jgi:hypothetical protein
MPSRLEAAVEPSLGEKRTRQAQDALRNSRTSRSSDLMRFSSAVVGPGGLAGITLLLAYPATQRFRYAAGLGCDRFDRSPLRVVRAGSLADHAHGALDDFGGRLELLLHSSILSNNGASTKPGAVHFS